MSEAKENCQKAGKEDMERIETGGPPVPKFLQEEINMPLTPLSDNFCTIYLYQVVFLIEQLPLNPSHGKDHKSIFPPISPHVEMS